MKHHILVVLIVLDFNCVAWYSHCHVKHLSIKNKIFQSCFLQILFIYIYIYICMYVCVCKYNLEKWNSGREPLLLNLYECIFLQT